MDKTTMNIWGKECTLKVIFECYGDQNPTEEQQSRLGSFLNYNNEVEVALIKLKQYCLEDEHMQGVGEITNIFDYFSPNSIYIKRNKKQKIVALLCDYKFDIEHGIAIVFEDGVFKEIVTQGDI